MRKKQLKEMHDKAVVHSDINNVLIKNALERLKQEDLTYERRIEEIELLTQELELQNELEVVKRVYRERNAEDKGYWIGVSGTLLGAFIAEVGPKLYKVLLKK